MERRSGARHGMHKPVFDRWVATVSSGLLMAHLPTSLFIDQEEDRRRVGKTPGGPSGGVRRRGETTTTAAETTTTAAEETTTAAERPDYCCSGPT